MRNEKNYMKRALELATKANGYNYPNPYVGAVIVKDGSIIGEGYHEKYGESHAEVNALNSCKSDPRGATMYVTMIPCNHKGNTPPCTKSIIESGIKQVVIAQSEDPNPIVGKSSISNMREAGIEVQTGLLEDEAKSINESFNTFHTLGRPFVAMKWASSLDGKIATRSKDSKWITSKEAREYSRKLRSHYQAILVGKNTVQLDNPSLGSIEGCKDPLRVVLDTDLSLTPDDYKVFRDKNVIVFTGENIDKENKKRFEKNGIDIVSLDALDIKISSVLSVLHKRNIVGVFVEGGSQAHGSLLDEELVDKVYAFIAPKLVGGKDALSPIRGAGVEKVKSSLKLDQLHSLKIDSDILISGYTNKSIFYDKSKKI